MIKSVSYSRMAVFEKCPQRAKLAWVDKIPEPVDDSGKESPLDRGTRIHELAEKYVRGDLKELPKELSKLEDNFIQLRDLYDDDFVSLEELWCFNDAWEQVEDKDWDNIWLRIKGDAVVSDDQGTITVVDYKGLPLDTPIPTPRGWTTMESIQVGDRLFDHEGKVCQVTGKSQVKFLPNYRLTFDDKNTVECDEEHLWHLADGRVLQVTELSVGDHIPVAAALELPEQELPLDPYLLGVWLADGKHTSGEVTNPEDEIWEQIKACGATISHDYSKKAEDGKCRVHTVYQLRTALRKLGLLANKHVPDQYMRASKQQRLALLQGLLDGDGSANETRKQVVWNTTDKQMAQQMLELVLSLGQRARMFPYTAHGFGKDVQAYQIAFRPNGIAPFRLSRKAEKVEPWGIGRAASRRIISIEQIPAQATQCIAVDSPHHTFLCTRNFVPTHNTGKKVGKEVPHFDQVTLYAVAAQLLFPDACAFRVELWYVDQGEVTEYEFTAEAIQKRFERYNERLQRVTSATEFPPKPNIHTCRYCPFKTGPMGKDGIKGTGSCTLNPV